MRTFRTVLATVPGLRTVQLPPPGLQPLPGWWLPPGWIPWVVVMDEASGFDNICVPQFYLDGRSFPAEEVPGVLTRELAAIEVYLRPSTAPIDLSFVDRSCGIVVMWSERTP